jgi:hypothetical protein
MNFAQSLSDTYVFTPPPGRYLQVARSHRYSRALNNLHHCHTSPQCEFVVTAV